MPEWMRSQFLAPMYALLVSFGVALALGYAMTPSTAPPQPATAPALTIRLVTVDNSGDKIPATDLAGTSARVTEAASTRTLEVGADGSIVLAPPNGQLTVCVALPEDWTAPGAQRTAAGSWCRAVGQTTDPIEFVVGRDSR
ncbi:hypothetical protein [Saccharothrix variisporea]|uniref:Uncharacterized protein n=1 Tax=Saccharothrix variisporea TaxID=543527 RepID=A0A495WZ86_9PSEU|nr:hypothetical protein [Saccharothrix variisporea]RKT66920.1 hypothetical protein DFJ66_0086 [Saccharothrix variisporea]